MAIDHASPIPLYAQIEAELASRIVNGTFAVGSRLPNEEGLIEQFSVSRTTIRQTIQNLIRRGLVEVRRGKGTFVTQTKIAQELTGLSGFVEDMHALGRHPSARVLDKRVVPANETVARKLDLKPGTPVIQIHRVRMADNVPLSFDETFLPQKIGEKVLEHNLETEPIFSLLEQKLKMPLVEAEYRLEAVAADAKVARALGIAAGSPVFLIERTSYCDGNVPVDYEKLHYRGDQVQFVTRLSRHGSDERPSDQRSSEQKSSSRKTSDQGPSTRRNDRHSSGVLRGKKAGSHE